jgi:hypothetical protein
MASNSVSLNRRTIFAVIALAILSFAGIAQAQTAPVKHTNNFHYGVTYTSNIDAFGNPATSTQKNAYCNTDGQDVGALFVEIYPTGAATFEIVNGGRGGDGRDNDWTTRRYENGTQATKAGAKYAAFVFNKACGGR